MYRSIDKYLDEHYKNSCRNLKFIKVKKHYYEVLNLPLKISMGNPIPPSRVRVLLGLANPYPDPDPSYPYPHTPVGFQTLAHRYSFENRKPDLQFGSRKSLNLELDHGFWSSSGSNEFEPIYIHQKFSNLENVQKVFKSGIARFTGTWITVPFFRNPQSPVYILSTLDKLSALAAEVPLTSLSI